MFDLRDYITKDGLEEFCCKHNIKKLSLFGSALRDELKPNSDIDILVEFENGKTPGLMGFCHIQNQLTDLIGREVELHTPNDLSRYFRDEVIENAMVQYG